MHHFGSEVRRAREAAGMSQSELGALVPCDKSAVSQVEAGLIAPDESFARACDAAFPQMGGWFVRFWKDSQTWGAVFPAAFRDFATYEAEAVALWSALPGGAAAAQARPLAAQATAVVTMAPAGSRRRHCSRSVARRSGVRDAT